MDVSDVRYATSTGGVDVAWQEFGDATAGSSIGAIVAGAVAPGDTPDDLAALMRAAVLERSPVDVTFPSIAFAAGGRVTQHIEDGAQGLDGPDTWCDFFCVSTDLTRGAPELPTRGPGVLVIGVHALDTFDLLVKLGELAAIAALAASVPETAV